jgi:hypothetical protein
MVTKHDTKPEGGRARLPAGAKVEIKIDFHARTAHGDRESLITSQMS